MPPPLDTAAGPPPVDRKSALLLNFTANTYHWGCYGTSLELYLTLVERGYYVNTLTVRATHALEPRPQQVRDFDDPAFATAFVKANPGLFAALDEADVVVVNGEGTLHRLLAAALNLLFLMRLAQRFLRKPVHLLNHSFFPSGTEQPDDKADLLYRGIAGSLTRVVPRETASAAVLQRLGVAFDQGFDCLPRFIARHGLTRQPRNGTLLVSGGVNLTATAAAQIAAGLLPFASTHRLVFLTGAKAFPAREDAATFQQMQAVLPSLELREAHSMTDWLGAIAAADALVSARFHHTLAAAALGIPVVVCPSNTPKISAVCAMLGLPPPIPVDTADLRTEIGRRATEALAGSADYVITAATRARLLELAERNFAGL